MHTQRSSAAETQQLVPVKPIDNRSLATVATHAAGLLHAASVAVSLAGRLGGDGGGGGLKNLLLVPRLGPVGGSDERSDLTR